MLGVLNNMEIKEVIADNIVGRLGCHANGKTYVVPISYAYEGDYIYFRTFEGMKISMMRANPEVCFQVDKMKNMGDWKSVVVWGTFEELVDKKKRKKGLEILLSRTLPNISTEMVKFTSEWPFPPTDDLNQIDGVVFRIHIKEMTGRCEKPDAKMYRGSLR